MLARICRETCDRPDKQRKKDPMASDSEYRYITRLTRETLAVILAGGRGSRLKHLTEWRAKPAVPFGGKFRIIDFALSNCINSGIRRISVLTQYKAHPLILHIQRGWGFLRGEFGEYVELLPAQQRIETSWYQGTADAVYQNQDIIRDHGAAYVLILGGDHVYKMDYGPMIACHVENRADVTVGCVVVPPSEASAFGVLTVDQDLRVTHFTEKPERPQSMPGRNDAVLASMGIYVFSLEFLMQVLADDARDPGSSHDFGKDVIPKVIVDQSVYAYPFVDVQTSKQNYWRDVGTVDAFWEANLELVQVNPPLDLYDRDWPIWTYQQQLPPAKFVLDEDQRRGMAIDSMVSGGCIISGAVVRRSLLFSNVRVAEHCLLDSAVVLPNVRLEPGCRIRNAVVDEGSVVPAGTVIGEDPAEDARRFYLTAKGVVLVTSEMLGQRRPHVR
jgi:glucose-1-phosphate adenylyltransferase